MYCNVSPDACWHCKRTLHRMMAPSTTNLVYWNAEVYHILPIPLGFTGRGKSYNCRGRLDHMCKDQKKRKQ